MRTTSVFKMKKQTKAWLALSRGDSHYKGMLKRLMIQAQLAEQTAIHAKVPKENE